MPLFPCRHTHILYNLKNFNQQQPCQAVVGDHGHQIVHRISFLIIVSLLLFAKKGHKKTIVTSTVTQSEVVNSLITMDPGD